jgi:hypothetical protein
LKFTRIPETTFQKLQLNAGIICSAFAPESGEVAEEALMGATTGGVSFTATPTYSDFGADIDNAPTNVKELKKLDTWEVRMSGSFVTVDVNTAKILIGSADIDGDDNTKLIPRNDLKDTDFQDIWWVGDYSDENSDENGGFVAIHMLNGLNTGGFSIQSNNNGKGEFAFDFMGHYSIEDQGKVPFEVYVKTGG